MTEAALEVRGLSFAYGDVSVLDGLTETFAAGVVTALTGPSGRGKSTLLYVLGLMLRPTAGEVRLGGERVDDLADARRAGLRAHSYGFVFQDAALDPTRKVLDNVMETALYRADDQREAQRRAFDLLERFGVRTRAAHRPGQISGGQAQRIALCRALLNDPRVLLADEPTGNLDGDSADVVTRALRGQAAAGAVVVVATHEPRMVKRCDRVVRL